MSILTGFSDLLYPRRCEICGAPADRPERHVCSACLMRIPFVPFRGCCRRCGRDVEGLDAEFLCAGCRGPDRPRFDRATSAVRFEGEARRMLLDYKFNRHLWVEDDLADWLEAAVRARLDADAVDAIVPVPTTRWHRYNRGYNQSACLARNLAARLDRRCDGGLLARCGHPLRQSALDERARRENVRGTFAARHPERIRGRTLLVVDDIMTTGSTLSECATVLKAAGASRVWCASVAKSVRS